MKITNVRYPEIKATIAELRKAAGVSVPSLARASAIKSNTIQSYVQGARKPSPASIRALADVLGRTPEERAVAFEKLRLVCHESEPAAPAFSESIARGMQSLVLESIRFEPFSNSAGTGFMDDFYRRFFLYSGIKTKFANEDNLELLSREQRILSGKTDVALNYLCTGPRLLQYDFLLTPIRVGLNACCFKRHRRSFEEVRKTILGDSSPKRRVKLIVVDSEVGSWFANNVGKLCTSEGIPALSPANLAKKLEEEERESELTGHIPVVLTTEPIALATAAHLKGKADLLFDLSSTQSLRRFKQRRELPQYRLGLAIDRDRNELRDLLHRTLRYFLLNDSENVALLYQHLYDELYGFTFRDLLAIHSLSSDILDREPYSFDMEQTQLNLHRTARDHARYVLRLDRNSVANFRDPFLPWKGVVSKARAFMHIRASENRTRIKQEVSSRLKNAFIHSQEDLTEQWQNGLAEQLSHDFDIDMPSIDANTVQPEFLIGAIQRGLFNEDFAQVRSHVIEIEKRSDRRAFQGRLLELEMEYERGMRLEGKRVTSEDDEILAKLIGLCDQELAGMATLRWSPSRENQLKSEKLHFKIHLDGVFVRKEFTRLSVGTHLVLRALERALTVVQEYSAESLTVFVLSNRLTPDVEKFFKKRGFEKNSSEDRLEYRLALLRKRQREPGVSGEYAGG